MSHGANQRTAFACLSVGSCIRCSLLLMLCLPLVFRNSMLSAAGALSAASTNDDIGTQRRMQSDVKPSAAQEQAHWDIVPKPPGSTTKFDIDTQRRMQLDFKLSTAQEQVHSDPLSKPSGRKEQPGWDIMRVMELNQKTRKDVKLWITELAMLTSVFNYGLGVPPSMLSKDTGEEPIQHDFVAQLGSRMTGEYKVRFLEIGVSVLKSIHTQLHFFENALIAAFDIEDPNPTLEEHWKGKATKATWAASPVRRNKMRKNDYLNQYQGPRGNDLFYVAADAFRDAAYAQIQQHLVRKYGAMNLILSDGGHTGRMLVKEVDLLLSYGIIQNSTSEPFAMVWDDCASGYKGNPGIWEVVRLKIFPRLKLEAFPGRAICYGRFYIPGWMGRNEFDHPTCVFTTFDLSGPHLGASKTWRARKNNVKCE